MPPESRSHHPPGEPEVDLVYTWVDGDSLEHQRQRAEYTGVPADLNPERFRDPLQMLRYSLRSMEMFAPWIRRVYLLTQRPQRPAWLVHEHPKLQVVHHDEVWEQPAPLPSFNSFAIESFMHRLPGLAEHWLYFNDDYFFGAPVERQDLFATEGSAILLGLRAQPRHGLVAWLRDLLVNPGWIEHAPNLIRSGTWVNMLERHAEWVQRTRSNRFRSPDDLPFHVLYRQHRRDLEGASPVPGYHQTRFVRLHRIDNRLAYQASELKRVKALKPRFFCLNDDQGDHPSAQVHQLVRSFLEEYFPNPSSFEAPVNVGQEGSLEDVDVKPL